MDARHKARPWDWNDDRTDWRTNLRFKYHGHQDPTADEAIANADYAALEIEPIEIKYPNIFAAARGLPHDKDLLAVERKTLRRGHLKKTVMTCR